MNAWNVHDMLAFVKCAELFGIAIVRGVDYLEVKRTFPNGSGSVSVVFNRTNGQVSLRKVDEVGIETWGIPSAFPGTASTWYQHLGIACDVQRNPHPSVLR